MTALMKAFMTAFLTGFMTGFMTRFMTVFMMGFMTGFMTRFMTGILTYLRTCDRIQCLFLHRSSIIKRETDRPTNQATDMYNPKDAIESKYNYCSLPGGGLHGCHVSDHLTCLPRRLLLSPLPTKQVLK